MKLDIIMPFAALIAMAVFAFSVLAVTGGRGISGYENHKEHMQILGKANPEQDAKVERVVNRGLPIVWFTFLAFAGYALFTCGGKP